MWCVCGQLRGVTLERNKMDYRTDGGGKIVADGVELKFDEDEDDEDEDDEDEDDEGLR